jgi:oligopeptidase B
MTSTTVAPVASENEPLSAPGASLVAPVAPRRPITQSIHGDVRVDEYGWLRDRNDPTVIAYLDAENRYTEQAMAATRGLREALYRELVARIREDDSTVPERRDGWLYLLRTETGRQYPLVCRRPADGDAAAEVVILDQNLEAEGHPYYRVAGMEASPDHRLLAWGEDASGSEEYVIRVRDLATGATLPDQLVGTSGNMAWSADGRLLYYVTLDAAHRPWRVLRHILGSDAAFDTVVYEEQDEAFFVGLEVTRSRRYLLIESSSHSTSETRFLPTEHPDAPLRLVRPRLPGVEYEVAHHGDRFYLLTNEGAANFQLVSVPVQLPSAPWTVVIPPQADTRLDAVDVFARHLVLYERSGGHQRVRVQELASGTMHYVAFPEPVYSIKRHTNPEFDTDDVRFTYTSLVTPSSVIDYGLDSRAWHVRKEQEVRGYDRTQYSSARLHATAPDGVQVPVSLVWKEPLALDGGRPLYLQGYGAYGVSFDPSYSSNYVSLLDRGIIVAIAHVRGGEELGRPWYDSGKLLHKGNSFTDFIAVAEHLVATGHTSSDRLAISGGSAGGLLMGAVTNLRPDLFRAVVADVPFVDVVNTMLDPTLPLTVIEYDEWGNPNDEAAYRYILSYSPYDNVRPQAYPAMLLTAGLNDPRVAFWEPAKLTARLRALRTNNTPLLLRTNMGAGHSGASGRYDFLREVAFKYAFVIGEIAT